MEEDYQTSFSDVLRALLSTITTASRSKDPRQLRLAAVTAAIVDVVVDANSSSSSKNDGTTMASDHTKFDSNNNNNKVNACSAAQVYAKAITALEGTLLEPVESSLPTQLALLELLEVTIPLVNPPSILGATFSLTSRVLRATVSSTRIVGDVEASNQNASRDGGGNAVLRWVCRVAAQCLKRLDNNNNNNHHRTGAGGSIASLEANVVKKFLNDTVLDLVEDRRPKVRKAAQGAIAELLRVEGPQKCHSTIRRPIQDYVHAKLVHARKTKDVDGGCLHSLGLLELIVLYLDVTKLGTDAMELLTSLIEVDQATSAAAFVSLMKVKESTPKVLTICAILSTVATMMRDVSFVEQKEPLDALAPRILASLLQARPALIFRHGAADLDVLQRGQSLYGQAMIAACHRVLESNPNLSCKLLPLAIHRVVLLSKPSDEQPEGIEVAELLMVELVQLFRTRLPAFANEHSGMEVAKCLVDSMNAMTKVLEEPYRPTWSTSLKTLVVLIELGRCKVNILDAVHLLINARNQVPAGSVSQQAVQDAFAALVQGVGLQNCWEWIEWQPGEAEGDPKPGIAINTVWILSVLKTASIVAQPSPPMLSFFQDQVLTLTRGCDKLACSSSKDKNFHRARVLDLWALFPSFCYRPSDLSTSLPTVASTLCRALVDARYPQLVTIICNGLRVLTESFTDDDADDGARIAMSQACEKLIPVLFKVVSESSSPSFKGGQPDEMQVDGEEEKTKPPMFEPEQVQAAVAAISHVARFASAQFIQSIFNKLMHRLVEAMQSESERSERVCALLALTQALVASSKLQEAEAALLYRTLKPLIRTDNHGPRVQKRAYKVLAELCEHNQSLVSQIDRLKELTSLLTSAMVTSHVSARYMRLRCMNILVDGFNDSNTEQLNEFLNVSAEILLCLKDSNAKTREAAYQLVISLSTRVGAVPYLKTIAAALAAETPHMRAAAVMAFSRIVFEFAWEDEELQSSLPSLLQAVLVLIDENSREVIKSVVGFIRICVAAIPPQRLQPHCKVVVQCLLKYHTAKNRFRAKIKIILKKLVKLFGYQFIEPFVPDSETKLITHMKKEEMRQKRKKESGREDETQAKGFEHMLESDEEGSDDGNTLMTGASGFSRLTGAASKMERTSSLRSRKGTELSMSSRMNASGKAAEVLLSNEQDGEVIDMLNTRMARRVKFADAEGDYSDSEDGAMEFDANGRLVVPEDHDNLQKQIDFDDAAVSGRRGKRRKLEASVGGSTRKSDSRSQGTKSNKQAQKHQLGATYRSRKAGGDVKRKDQKLEPYAFVPLDGRSYSKKNRRAAVEQMSSVVSKGKRKR